MRTGEFLDGIGGELRAALPPEWADIQSRRQAALVKFWYQEPRLHYEVWPVSGRDLIEVGLHFETDASATQWLLEWFDPHIIRLKAALGGAVELEQWTPSWGHLFRVYHATTLTPALQSEVAGWLARLIPLAEPILRAGLAEMGEVAAPASAPRDWAAWRERRARRARSAAIL